MTLLRPQNVAAASVRTAEGNAVARRATRGGRSSPGLLLALAVAVGLCVATSSGAADAKTRLVALRPLEQSVLIEMNALRLQYGLVPLRLSRGLTVAAGRHSREMASRGYFDHNSANGEVFSRRITRSYAIGRRRSWSVGENLLWSPTELNAAAVLDIWLGSREHRANMLKANWRDVGVGAVHASSAPGVYGGRDVTIVTADFGLRH